MIAETSRPRLIWYLLVDSSTGQLYKATTASSVVLPSDFVIDQFRDAVKAKWDEPGYLQNIPAGVLLVFKNKAAYDNRNAKDDKKEEPLEEDSLIGDWGMSKKEALIVVVPVGISVSEREATRKDVSKKLYEELTKPFPREPDIHELYNFLSADPLVQIPLIPSRSDVVTKYFFESEMEKFRNYFRCSFVDDSRIARSLETVSDMTLKLGSGESMLHYYIDFFMHEILEVILASPTLKVFMDRNTGDRSKTTLAKRRPDFLFYVNSFLILRGEEKKDAGGFHDAVGELTAKLKSWNAVIFGRMKYVFGYALAGESFKFYAIGPKGLTVPISNMLDLQQRSDRFELFFLLINLARVIKTIVARFPSDSIMLYRETPREDGCTIEIRDDVVVKRVCVSTEDWDQRFEFLQTLYDILHKNSVPCVSKCPDIRKCTKRKRDKQFIELFILPLGCQVLPQSVEQLLTALKCVLRALVGLHQHKYAHQDIRWANLLYVSDNNWILIDFENAAYGNDVLYQQDMRMIGKLIDYWNQRNPTQIARALSTFRNMLESETPPCAADALRKLEHLDVST
jgi:hypothetical protein